MKSKRVRTVTKKDWQSFIDTMTSIINQCDRMKSLARGQGKTAVPAAEYWEMHGRFEKAVSSFLGEKRRILESREAFFNRVVNLCGQPAAMLETMHRNGIRVEV